MPAARTAEEIWATLARARVPRDREAKRLLAKLAAADRERRRAAFVIGETLATFLRKKLWANLGAGSFTAFAASLGFGRAQAWKLVTVGERSTAAEVERLGVEAAYALAVRRPARKKARP